MKRRHRVIIQLLLISFALIGIALFAGAGDQDMRPRTGGNYLVPTAPGGRVFIGHELPLSVETRLRAQQAPTPDLNVTPFTTGSDEAQPNWGINDVMNRFAFVSDGIDDDGDGAIDPLVKGDNLNIWIARPDGSGQQQITDLPDDEWDVAWDPGGRRIAFASDQMGTDQIFTIDVQTQVIQQITQDPGNKGDPTWSPDQRFICYTSDINDNLDLFSVSSTGAGTPLQLTTSPDEDDDPEWSPVGSRIIFESGPKDGLTRLWTVLPDGSNLEQVSNGGGDPLTSDKDPTWRKNGQNIAFASNRLFGTDPDTGLPDTIYEYNIFLMSPMGEVLGAPAVGRTNPDARDIADDDQPNWQTEPLSGVFYGPRVFFRSNRLDGPADTQPDYNIWRFHQIDTRPPVLEELPWTALPGDPVDSVTRPNIPRREYIAGNDAAIHARVTDIDTGVGTVFAQFKDPDSAEDDSQGIDHKLFMWSGPYPQDMDIFVALEYDCDIVGATQLFDDGDPANSDTVAGDGIFSGVWTTPMSVSDFLIDVTVSDTVGNSMTFDDSFGLTTEPFVPDTNTILVIDHCHGQAFVDAMLWYHGNQYGNMWAYESYLTTNPGGIPYGNTWFNTINDYIGEQYDLWRIQCRGPVTQEVLNYYVPTEEQQPIPPEPGQGTTTVRVSDRCIVWEAPLSGDVWACRGSIIDAATQSLLAQFLDRGGALIISGQDIGWALTLDGTVNNTFYTNYLHADYVNDSRHTLSGRIGPWLDRLEMTGAGGDPVAFETWSYHYEHQNCQPLDLDTSYETDPGDVKRYPDASWYIFWEEVIDAIGGAIPFITYDEGGVAALRYQDPALGYRVVYFAMDLSHIHRDYHTVNNWDHCMNKRGKLLHNAMCWTRTGSMAGRVLSIDRGMRPINDPPPIVRVLRGGNVIAAGLAEEDGSYHINGIPPAIYRLQAYRPGYRIEHAHPTAIHGGMPRFVDFTLSEAQPGAIAGTVTSRATGSPIANVVVTALEQVTGADPDLDDITGTTLTGADGGYTIPNLPVGDYDVTADGTALGYNSVTLPGVVVTPGSTTEDVDFQLDAADGMLEATVLEAGTNAPIAGATVQVKIVQAVVASEVTDANGEAEIDVQPGGYDIVARAPGFGQSLPEGITIVSQQTSDITITLRREPPGAISGLVVRQTDGQPLGAVTVTLWDGAVPLMMSDGFGGFIPAETQTTAQVSVDGSYIYNWRIPVAPDTFAVPTGTYEARATKQAFSAIPTSQTVDIQSGLETRDVRFEMTTLHTFPAGLSLVSTPYGYTAPNQAPNVLLGLPAAELLLAAWQPDPNSDVMGGEYVLWPRVAGETARPPVDRFRLGQGYWLKLATARDLDRIGSRAETPYEIPLLKGWNMIGGPFPDQVDYFLVRVRVSGQEMGLQQSLSRGHLQNGLFGWGIGGYHLSTVLLPFAGYWQAANETAALIVDEPPAGLAAREAARITAEERSGRRLPVARPKDGWVAPIVAQAGELSDTATYFGAGPDATNGYDAQYDVGKPPMVDFAPQVYVSFEHPEWGAAVPRTLASEVRAADQGAQQWSFTVTTTAPAEDVALSWPDLSQLPKDARPVLKDLETGQTVAMRTARSYAYRAHTAQRRFEISVSPNEGGALVVRATAVPTRTGIEFVCTLSRAAELDATILNISGRPIRSLIQGAAHPAGASTLTWDARGDSGLASPNGTYLLKVRARSEDGSAHQALVPFAVVR